MSLSKIENANELDTSLIVCDMRDGTWVFAADSDGALTRVCALKDAKCADFLKGYQSYLDTVVEIDNAMSPESWLADSKFSADIWDAAEVKAFTLAGTKALRAWQDLKVGTPNTEAIMSTTVTTVTKQDNTSKTEASADTSTQLQAVTTRVEAIKEEIVQKRVSDIAAYAVLSLPVWLTLGGVLGAQMKLLDAFWLFLGSMASLLMIGIPLKQAIENRLFAALNGKIWSETKYAVLAVFLLLGSLGMIIAKPAEQNVLVWIILTTLLLSSVVLRNAIMNVRLEKYIESNK